MSQGNLKSLNELAAQARADFIIHTGDFGFYDEESLKRIADKWVHYNSFIELPPNIIFKDFKTCCSVLTTPLGKSKAYHSVFAAPAI